MVVKFYNQTSDKHVVSKVIGTPVAEYSNAIARDSFDVRHGDIVISSDQDLSKVNYCYIEDLARYYYVKEITIERTGVYVFSLECDVLKTFEAGIRALTGTVERQENRYNGYIADPSYKALAYSQIVTKTFPNAMDQDHLILMTVG